jgi:MYXO-CTERM domain-containing protein
VRDWIERTIGEPLPRPVCTEVPIASAAPLAVRAGNKAKIDLTVSDDGADWTVTVLTPPAHGEVEIDGRAVTYRAPKGYAGPDPFELQVVDDGAAAWPDNPPGVALVSVELDVFEGKVPDELKDRVAGCACDGAGPGRAAPWGVAGLLALVGLRRRR